MLRIVAHQSAAAASQYYAKGLRREDYYSEKQEVVGQWHGQAAELLGLRGAVTPEAFAALVENRHPETGARLTARTKAERVAGWDLNFHAPKSLSVLHGLTGDEKLVKAFRAAVVETMSDIEAQVATRVRKGGTSANRITGNLAWAEFVHFTARPVGGIPDPHLHVHAFVQNATFDVAEGRWKAIKLRGIKQDAPYFEAVFHARLTEKLVALGYGIQRTPLGWEIQGIPRDLIERFSRRTAQIDRLAAEQGITDAKVKDALGAATREGKRRGLKQSDLRAAWEARLAPDERALIASVHRKQVRSAPAAKISAQAALDYASEKLFAKNSVVETKRLVAEALRYGVGQLAPEQAWQEFARRKMVTREIGGVSFCTSLDVLGEEVALINFVRTGRGRCAPFVNRAVRFTNEKLSDEQRAAVRHILSNRDQVMALRGAAGVGKTTLMREAVAAIEATGIRVFAFAPSAAASRETLRESGFANAQTVAHLLTNTKLQRETRGQVIWIDEAGLLGVREMWQILRLAGNSTRVILTGDAYQHAPVARGDAFRLLQKYAGLKIVEVTQIRRQERAEYREAVAALSKGDLRTAFRRLDALGAVLEVADDAERYRMLAADYLGLLRQGTPPLVVSPTHAESEKVTAAIREAKRAAGLLRGERSFRRLHNLQWEEADRKRAENYVAGLRVQFHQNTRGIKRGEIFRVIERDANGVVQMESDAGRKVALPLAQAARFQVFEEREIRIARGDRIRITRNGESADGRRLNNGNVFTVERFARNGDIILHTGATLDAKHGHFTYGYCQTSHSAQSKTVRDVLVAQSAESFGAASREQFYVSVSRGKETIRIYTDNRRELQQAVGNTSTRKAGIELAAFTAQDVASFMSTELNARQWRDAIQSRRVEGQARTHVQNLLKERRQDGTKKEASQDWRQYIEMRRQLTGASGRHRAKSTPSVPGKQGSQTKEKSFLRPTLPQSAKAHVTEPINAKSLQKLAKSQQLGNARTREGRLAKAYDSAAENLQHVLGRGQAKLNANRPRALPASNNRQIAKHGAKQRTLDAGLAAKKPVKVQAPPPPTPKRGR
jgi:conjugative relaxase-like TrwC/TraI family protein